MFQLLSCMMLCQISEFLVGSELTGGFCEKIKCIQYLAWVGDRTTLPSRFYSCSSEPPKLGSVLLRDRARSQQPWTLAVGPHDQDIQNVVLLRRNSPRQRVKLNTRAQSMKGSISSLIWCKAWRKRSIAMCTYRNISILRYSAKFGRRFSSNECLWLTLAMRAKCLQQFSV